MNNYKKLYTVSGMTCDGCVQTIGNKLNLESEISEVNIDLNSSEMSITADKEFSINELNKIIENVGDYKICLLYTSPSPRDGLLGRMPASA